MYIYVYICIYIYLCINIFVYWYLYIYVCSYASIHIYMHTHLPISYTRMHVWYSQKYVYIFQANLVASHPAQPIIIVLLENLNAWLQTPTSEAQTISLQTSSACSQGMPACVYEQRDKDKEREIERKSENVGERWYICQQHRMFSWEHLLSVCKVCLCVCIYTYIERERVCERDDT